MGTETLPSALGAKILGDDAYAFAGSSLEISDLDGDGQADISIGAIGAGPSGAVFVYLDTPSGTQNLSSADVLLNGEGGLTGSSLSTADSNGDGRSDLAIGNPGSDFAGGNSGVAYLVLGGPLW